MIKEGSIDKYNLVGINEVAIQVTIRGVTYTGTLTEGEKEWFCQLMKKT